MKKSDRIKKLAAETMNKIHAIARHIRNVEDNCLLLGTKLIDNGDIDLGKQLIANGYAHDISKFYGIEFEQLTYSGTNITTEENGKLKLKIAIHHHEKTNKHHPESWAMGIKEMPDVYLCEMLCDWKSRSEEFGTDLRHWINEQATKRWEFSNEDDVYKKIMKYVDMLCPTPFENITRQ